jgi:hypothetical protein
MIAIFIHTFLRDDLMKRCVESCLEHIPNCRIYLTDGGLMNDWKRGFYDELRKKGHFVEHKKEYNYPWRKAFNEKLEKLQDEKYIMKIDDDMFFKEEHFNLKEMMSCFKKDIGMVGCTVWHYIHNNKSWYLFNIKKTGYRKYEWEFCDTMSKIITCDVIPDFWIAKREVFDDVRMNGEMLVGEAGHEDFFMRIWVARQLGKIKWKIAFNKNARVEHEKGTNTKEYKRERSKNKIRTGEFWGEIIKPKRPY